MSLTKGTIYFFSDFDYEGVFGSFGELIGTAIASGIDLLTALRDVLSDAWDEVVEYFKGYIEDSGGNIIEGLLNGILEALADIGKWIEDNIFKPFLDGFKKAFGIHSPSTVMKGQGNYIMDGLLKGITEMIGSVVEKFTEIKDTVIKVWEKIKSSTTSIWNGIQNAVKTPVNAIIGFINRMISGIISGINSMTRALNSISFTVPDWVPVIGGGSFGFNIPQISSMQIPALATGAVIPPNKEFLAVLGDQKHGTNIEAPEALMRKAFREELKAEIGSIQQGSRNITYNFSAQINRRTLFDEMINEAILRQTATGRNPFELI